MLPALGLGLLVALTAGGADKPSGCCVDLSSKKIATQADAPRCWERDIENNKRVQGKPVSLDKRFDGAKITSTVVTVKLCIDQTGVVQRVLLLRSSGNSDLDNHVCEQVLGWRFRAPERSGRQVESVSYVAVTLHR